eukprot:744315-Pyramimonas_sp.AAC.1
MPGFPPPAASRRGTGRGGEVTPHTFCYLRLGVPPKLSPISSETEDGALWYGRCASCRLAAPPPAFT